jgi:hypothetical protein
MAEKAAKNPPPKDNGKSNTPTIPIVSLVLKVVSKIFFVSIFAGMVLLLIELVMYFFVDDPIQASYQRYLAISNFGKTGSWFNEGTFIHTFEQSFMHYLRIEVAFEYVQVFVDFCLDRLGKPSPSKSTMYNFMVNFSKVMLEAIPDLLKLWIVVTFTWFAKLLTIFAMLLPCLVIVVGGFIDGTVERKINTFKGKRDSQDKIEWWFLAFKASSYTVLILYMAIPNSFQATLIMLPSAVLTAFFVRGVAASYKKYW